MYRKGCAAATFLSCMFWLRKGIFSSDAIKKIIHQYTRGRDAWYNTLSRTAKNVTYSAALCLTKFLS